MTPEEEIAMFEADPESQDAALRAALEFQRAAEEDGNAMDRITAQMEATRLRALAAGPKPKTKPIWWRIS